MRGGLRGFLRMYPAPFALPGLSVGFEPVFSGKTATIVAVDSAEIEYKCYTPKGSQLEDARCVLNYHEFDI